MRNWVCSFHLDISWLESLVAGEAKYPLTVKGIHWYCCIISIQGSWITPLATLLRRQVYHVGFAGRYGRGVMDVQYPFSCVYFHVRKTGIGHFLHSPLTWQESSLTSGHLEPDLFLSVAGCSCLIVCSVSLEILQVSAFLFLAFFFFFFNWGIAAYNVVLVFSVQQSESAIQFSSVAQSCPALCDPMNLSRPGLPVHHQLPESTPTHVHWVSDAIQPSHPLSSPSPPAFSLSQHQGLFQWVSSSPQVATVLEFQLQHQSFQWTPRTDLL